MTPLSDPLPTAVVAGDRLSRRIRVLDANSGEPIAYVAEADAAAGRVRRFAVEDGAFVREGNALKIIEEDRAIRFEWIDVADGVITAPAAEEEA